MADRIKQLEEFIADDPNDPFNYYALALEYAKVADPRALDTFSYIITHHTDYLPAYYQLAKLYAERGRKDDAIRAFEEGSHIAVRQNDLKTLHELRAGLEELQEDD
jgi:tetratricopeptide (TPR) repeat protein